MMGGDLVANLNVGSGLLGQQAPMPPPPASFHRHDQWRASAIDGMLGGSDVLDDLGSALEDRDRRFGGGGSNKRKHPGGGGGDGSGLPSPADEGGGKPRKAQKGKGKGKDKGKDAEGGKDASVPKQSRSGRTLKATNRLAEGVTDEDDESTSESGFSLTTICEEEKFMNVIEHGALEIGNMPTDLAGVNDELRVGQHVVYDFTEGRPPPSEEDPRLSLVTSSRPAPSNVGVVTKVLPRGGCVISTVCNCGAGDGDLRDPADAMKLAHMGNDSCVPCKVGTEVKIVKPEHRQQVCSACFHVNLKMAMPTLWCSGCATIIKSGSTFHKDHGERLNIKLCNRCFHDIGAGLPLEYLPEMELDPRTFDVETWDAKASVDYDFMVCCDGPCARWFHYCCALYPDHVTLPDTYRLDTEGFVCKSCRKAGATADGARRDAPPSRLLALKDRRACHLRRHPLSDAIEGYLYDVLRTHKVVAKGLVVRVVSSRRFAFRALPSMKERYGPDYPDDFPYDSRAIFAFQEVDGRDVCVFAMYVQEYGPTCPRPNTGRTYISYLDSVRYLVASPAKVDGQSSRTLIYHAIINGYIADARDRGFEHAHIWVAPPQYGDDYIFHCHPADKQHSRPMSMGKLREWYVGMLQVATADGIVASFEDIKEHVSQLSSIRDFPLFEGDFFPDHLKDMLAPPPPTTRGPPMLGRETSYALAATLKGKTKEMRKRFLVAKLQPRADADGARAAAVAAIDAADFGEISDPLIDKRSDFLNLTTSRHWEWRELRRAHFSTMMLLASVGGAP